MHGVAGQVGLHVTAVVSREAGGYSMRLHSKEPGSRGWRAVPALRVIGALLVLLMMAALFSLHLY